MPSVVLEAEAKLRGSSARLGRCALLEQSVEAAPMRVAVSMSTCLLAVLFLEVQPCLPSSAGRVVALGMLPDPRRRLDYLACYRWRAWRLALALAAASTRACRMRCARGYVDVDVDGFVKGAGRVGDTWMLRRGGFVLLQAGCR